MSLAISLLDLVFPPRCPLCGEGLAAGADGLCASCWSGLSLPAKPACGACQKPLSSAAQGHADAHGLGVEMLCGQCAKAPPEHSGIAAATLYNDRSRLLVLGLKYRRQLGLAPYMARLMARELQALPARAGLEGFGPDWQLVPVPLHRWRLWGRGFNQSAQLARGLAQITGAGLVVDGLRRDRHTPKLMGMDAAQRAATLAGAIGVSAKAQATLAGRNIVLVDDVLTSGATSNACITALKAAGARQVALCCFARVINSALP